VERVARKGSWEMNNLRGRCLGEGVAWG